MSVINRQAINETFAAAELYKDGLLEVSNTDSAVICQDTGVADFQAARVSLVNMLGQVGRVLPIAVEGVDF